MFDPKSVKKIDIHAHALAFPEYAPFYKPGDPTSQWICAEDLIEMYDRLGIETGVLLPIVSAEGQLTPITTEMTKYLVDKYPDRFEWFCGVDPRAFPNSPDSDLVSLINHYKALGAKGVGEITTPLNIDDPRMYNLFAACAKCDMPAIIHINFTLDKLYGMYDDLGLPRIEKLLADMPDLKLIGHSTVFWTEISGDVTEASRGQYPKTPVTEGGRIVALMRKYPNLYCDISAGSGHGAMMRDPDFTARFIEEFSDRILYGCDICFATNTHPFPFVDFLEQMVADGNISEENYRKLVRENAIRILKLDK